MEEEWMKFLNERGTQKTCKKMPLFADTYKHKHKQHIPTQHLYMCLHIQIESNPLHVSTPHVNPNTICLTLTWSNENVSPLLSNHICSDTHCIISVGIYETLRHHYFMLSSLTRQEWCVWENIELIKTRF